MLFGSAYVALRRALERDQRRPLNGGVPLWRLLAEEVVLMARRIGRWKVWTVAIVEFVCFLAVEVALSSSTPGPALAEPWRWALAVALTAASIAIWVSIHAVRSAPTPTTTSG